MDFDDYEKRNACPIHDCNAMVPKHTWDGGLRNYKAISDSKEEFFGSAMGGGGSLQFDWAWGKWEISGRVWSCLAFVGVARHSPTTHLAVSSLARSLRPPAGRSLPSVGPSVLPSLPRAAAAAAARPHLPLLPG